VAQGVFAIASGPVITHTAVPFGAAWPVAACGMLSDVLSLPG
jgi:hypothetical protein